MPAFFRAVSAIPGRVRLQTSGDFRSQKSLKEIADYAVTLPGVTEATIVADAYSVVVRYASAERPFKEMLSLLEAAPLTRHAPARSVQSVAANAVSINEQAEQAVTKLFAAAARKPKAHVVDAARHHIHVKHFFPGRIRLHP